MTVALRFTQPLHLAIIVTSTELLVFSAVFGRFGDVLRHAAQMPWPRWASEGMAGVRLPLLLVRNAVNFGHVSEFYVGNSNE